MKIQNKNQQIFYNTTKKQQQQLDDCYI
jgi:hypothetical protein